MKCEIETKKISMDPGSYALTITVEFTLGKYTDLDKFKESLTDFQLKMTGQKKLG